MNNFFFLTINSRDKIPDYELEPEKLTYFEILSAGRIIKHDVHSDDFGDLGFWNELEINDPL